MRIKKKAAPGAETGAAHNEQLHRHLTERLARTKHLLIGAYGLHALTFAEAELISSRLRRHYAAAWGAA